MAKIKVLIEGYAKEDGKDELASCSVTLLQENGLNIIVDPGMDRPRLLESLKGVGLSTGDVNYVIVTHTHLDHCMLAGIFENAKIVDSDSIYSSEDGRISAHDGKVPGTEITIVKTPGHDQFHCSVLANAEKFGKVIIAGDVFWWRDDESRETEEDELIRHADPYTKDESQLTESRKMLLETADYIVPGHGKMFKTK